MAKGRYDQPDHILYSPTQLIDTSIDIPDHFRRVSILWHDTQVHFPYFLHFH